jgi:hypothetical protein
MVGFKVNLRIFEPYTYEFDATEKLELAKLALGETGR